MMCIFGMMFVGIFVDMCAKNTLRLGIAENRWPDRLLEGTRELVNRRIFSLISGVFLAGAILSMFISFTHMLDISAEDSCFFIRP